MSRRPTNASAALALCALGAGVLAMVLTFAGWELPVAVLAGVVVGSSCYMAILIFVRQSRR